MMIDIKLVESDKNVSSPPFKNLGNILKDKKGEMFPMTVAVAICLLFLLLVAMEFFKLMITASGIKDAYEEAMISVVTDNYNEVYTCVREGYASGQIPTGYGFNATVDIGDVEERLSGLLGLTSSGGTLNKVTDAGNIQYQISDINVTVPNTPILRSGQKFYAEGTLKMTIPVLFAGHRLFDVPINLKVKAVMREVF